MRGAEDGGPADRAGAETGMRARHGEGDGRDAGSRPAPGGVPGTEALLAAALRGERADAEGERRAVAAFRAAREAEPARAARTRRRDDWRPRDGRHPGRTLKTALSVLLASLALGGVAYAAMGGGGTDADDGGPPRDRTAAPTDSASVQPLTTPPAATSAPATTASTPPGASAPPDRPAAAGDTEADCRAYERLEGRGRARDATAWQRLVTAAGGAEHVEAHCADRPATETGRGPSNADEDADENADGGNGAAGNGDEGNGDQENGGSGNGGGGNAEGQVPGRGR
ncbi:hypothetical protein [Streptomyces sp. NPDC019793]|uniref:hypothetical protein n=1 Tax=unclassified Streptomyces TaxID=2593676 RepID=UPI0033D2FBB5